MVFTPHPPGYDRLIEAIDKNSPALVKSLLDSGIDPNKFPNSDGNLMTEDDLSPLNDAIDGGHVAVVEVLLKHGADSNLGDGWHRNPLAAAAENGNLDIMMALTQSGARINDDSDGSSALWFAAMYGKAASVKFLLNRGADPYTRNAQDSLLHSLQTDFPNPEIEKLLRDQMAKTETPVPSILKPPKR